MKILEQLRKVVARFDKIETQTFIIDVVPRNIRSNTVSGTDISIISDMVSSEFEIVSALWMLFSHWTGRFLSSQMGAQYKPKLIF